MTHWIKLWTSALVLLAASLSYAGNNNFPQTESGRPSETRNFITIFQEERAKSQAEAQAQLERENNERIQKELRLSCFKNEKKPYSKILKRIIKLLRPIQLDSKAQGGPARLASAAIHLNELVEIHKNEICESTEKENRLSQLLNAVNSDLDLFDREESDEHNIYTNDEFITRFNLKNLDQNVIDLVSAVKDQMIEFNTVGFNIEAGPAVAIGAGFAAGTATTPYGARYSAILPHGTASVSYVGISAGWYRLKTRNRHHFSNDLGYADSAAFLGGGTLPHHKSTNKFIAYEGRLSPIALYKGFALLGVRLFPLRSNMQYFMKNLGITPETLKLPNFDSNLGQ